MKMNQCMNMGPARRAFLIRSSVLVAGSLASGAQRALATCGRESRIGSRIWSRRSAFLPRWRSWTATDT